MYVNQNVILRLACPCLVRESQDPGTMHIGTADDTGWEINCEKSPRREDPPIGGNDEEKQMFHPVGLPYEGMRNLISQ